MGTQHLALGLALASATACHARPQVAVIDPDLPSPTFCVSARERCDLDGPSYYAHELKVTARPVDEPAATPSLVWHLRLPIGETGVAVHLEYGSPPEGWTQAAKARPLEPGVLYHFETIEFIVEDDHIVELR